MKPAEEHFAQLFLRPDCTLKKKKNSFVGVFFSVLFLERDKS